MGVQARPLHFLGFRGWPKTLADFVLEKPDWRPFGNVTQPWPKMILFGQDCIRRNEEPGGTAAWDSGELPVTQSCGLCRDARKLFFISSSPRRLASWKQWLGCDTSGSNSME
jgi:hypothetical protein